MTTTQETEDPARWEDLFVRDVDEQPVQFVRPADTDRPGRCTRPRSTGAP
ncbi:hypothetical protein [Actinacidiphila sp. ITFR-21]|nr:hypothetical protein [Streptomyces sp. ITFR-21]WNI19974.1 hypothetical protein RLT57_31010 [Streptomyces sp. ITFR-21]